MFIIKSNRVIPQNSKGAKIKNSRFQRSVDYDLSESIKFTPKPTSQYS